MVEETGPLVEETSIGGGNRTVSGGNEHWWRKQDR